MNIMKKCSVAMVGHWLVVVGALNWGLIGVGYFLGQDWNVVHMVLGNWPWLEALVYVLVGVSGVACLVGCRCKVCKP